MTALRFSAKVKEIDRQYELNNNADLDNGVYHQEEDGEEAKDGSGGSDGPSKDGGSKPPRPTEERAETQQRRNQPTEEVSINDSFNKE